jgi:signal transduction histidine kinase
VHPSRLFRTSSFRLTLGYAALFTLSTFLLGVTIYLSAAEYLADSLDAQASTEVDEVLSAARGVDLSQFATVVTAAQAAHPEHDMLYLLQDAGGQVLAGALGPMNPTDGMHVWDGDGKPRPQGAPPEFRGRGVHVVDNAFLFIGVESSELTDLKRSITRTFGWGVLAALVLGVVAGGTMSRAVTQRVEVMAQVSHEIVDHDLSRRMPIRGTGDEFDQLAENLNALFDRIQLLMTGVRQVSTDIAHDLRTPLTRLRQRLELAYHAEPEADNLRTAISNSMRDVDTILETFGALLRVAEIDARSRMSGFATFELADLLHTMIDDYQPVAEEQGRSITATIAPNLPVHADSHLLTQLLANLLDNALRHTPPASGIEISGFRDGNSIIVEIADHGPGIAPEHRDKVFQPLYRLEASRNTPGTGMGLSIVAAIARQHRIQVSLLDNLPGLRVRLRFPEDAASTSDTPGLTPVV